MKRFLPATFFFILLVILFFLYFSKDSKKAQADTASHVVISEIQTGKTGAATDEFVELYNPTSSDVNLAGWRLTKKNSSGNEAILVASLSGTIKSYGFFLIAHSEDYTGSVSGDIFYSAPSLNIANTNNSVVLYSDAGVTEVDLVGFGSAPANETASASNPSSNGSIERKADSLSTSSSMLSDGTDEFLGNGEDTNNNANDFLTRSAPDPQNSSSTIEQPIVPSSTPTSTPTPTTTLTPTPTNTPTPTSTPTPTPTSSSSSESSSSSDSQSVSSASCSDSKPGSAPKLLSTEAGINSVFLRWSEATDPVSYYLVAYGLSSGAMEYGNPNVGGKGTTSYTVNGLSGSATYYFKVRAGNGCSPGGFSNELTGFPLGREINSDLANNFTQEVLGASEGNISTGVSEGIKGEKADNVLTSVQTKNIEQSLFQKVWSFMFFPLNLVWELISKLRFF